MKLLAFNEVGTDPGSLFVAFSDLTNGTETYAAGRFMDLTRNRTGIYEVDFNRAYIPYCYYNPTYECPLPPPENRLKIPDPRRREDEVGSQKSEVRSRRAAAAIVFDFDGVIAEQRAAPLPRLSRRARRGRHRADRGATTTRTISASTTSGAFEAIGGAARGRLEQRARSTDLVARKAVRLEALERDVSVLFPGAADAIRRASAALPIAIASGARGDEIRRVLESRAARAPASRRSSPRKTRRSASPRPIRICALLALLAAAIGGLQRPATASRSRIRAGGSSQRARAGLRTRRRHQIPTLGRSAAADLDHRHSSGSHWICVISGPPLCP